MHNLPTLFRAGAGAALTFACAAGAAQPAIVYDMGGPPGATNSR